MADPGRFERIRRRLGRGGDPEAADLDEAEGPAPEGSDQPATEETGPGPAPEGWEGPALGDLRGGRRDSITDRLHAIADRIAAARPSLDLGAGFAAAAGAIRRGASTLGGRLRSTADAAGSAARSGSAAMPRCGRWCKVCWRPCSS